MKFLLCSLLSIIVIGNPLLGQSNPNAEFLQKLSVDSLEKRLAFVRGEEEKVNILNELAFRLRYRERTQALEYAKTAYGIAVQHGFIEGEGDSHMRLGVIYKNLGQHQLSLDHYQRAATIRVELGNVAGAALAYSQMGKASKTQGKIEEAKMYYQRGLDLLEPPDGYLKEKGRILLGLSNLYRDEKNYRKALELLESRRMISEKLADKKGLATVYLQQGILYDYLENHGLSKESFEESLQLYEGLKDSTGIANCNVNLGNNAFHRENYDEAHEFFLTAFSLLQFLNKDNQGVLLTNLGATCSKQNNYDKALSYYDQALTYFEDGENQSQLASIYHQLGELFNVQENHERAISYLNKGLTIVEQIDRKGLELKLRFQLFQAYTKSGQSAAATSVMQGYHQLRDSIVKGYEEATNYKLDLERERVEQVQAKAEFELATASLKNRNITYLSAFLILLLVSLSVGIYSFINQQRKRAEMRHLETEQKIDQLLQNQELQFTYAKLAGQDMERKRVAQDLHDRVGSTLAAVKLHLDKIEKSISAIEFQGRPIETANQLLDHACNEVRSISQNLQSSTILKFGLLSQVRNLVDSINAADQLQVKLNVFGFGEERLALNKEIEIYRILQELSSNTMKHAQAKILTIQLNKFKDVLNVIVEDDGIGFMKSEIKDKSGMGLHNVQSRVINLKGKILIDSVKGRGTSVSIDLPLSGQLLSDETQSEDLEEIIN
ncbi:MAG: tetratricopeptide repeat protein [Bacteroidota bacterium]